MTNVAHTHPRRALGAALAAAVIGGVLYVGAATSPAATTELCNKTPIIGVAGDSSHVAPYPADPYPSKIAVSGISGTVSDVNVRLLDFTTHPDPAPYSDHWPEDIDVLLVAPNQANVILMSDAGGDNGKSHPVSGADFTLDDSAAAPLPADTQLTSGTYRPVDDDDDPNEQLADDIWPNAPAPSNSTSLSTFNGIDPSGTWSLYVVDDTNLGASDFSGGWCIDISSGSTSTSTSTTVAGGQPKIAAGDVSVTEGDSGTRTANFPVTLSNTSAFTVKVDYTTVDDTAVDGKDYAARSGTLSFPAGTATGVVKVPIKGDTVDEGNEAFKLKLSGPVNATAADAVGVATIVDDDPGSGARLAIGDVTIYEGDSGGRAAQFTVSLSKASTETVTVDYSVSDGTATRPADYGGTSGTVTFSPGVTNKSVKVPVKADTLSEGDETFKVLLSNVTGGATITDGTGAGTIRDDD